MRQINKNDLIPPGYVLIQQEVGPMASGKTVRIRETARKLEDTHDLLHMHLGRSLYSEDLTEQLWAKRK